MTLLTNGQHACVLAFVAVADILEIPCDYQFVFSVLIFHTTPDAVDNILRVHYKCTGIKCEVSFSQSSINML